MDKKEAKALLAEFNRAANAFSQLVATWTEDKANKTLPTAPDKTYISAVKQGIRASYEYILWIQKSAALPRMSPPDFISNLETVDLKTVKAALNLLGPVALESLSGLTDDQLQYRPVRDYTLEQMLEHAIVSIWLQVGQVEH